MATLPPDAGVDVSVLVDWSDPSLDAGALVVAANPIMSAGVHQAACIMQRFCVNLATFYTYRHNCRREDRGGPPPQLLSCGTIKLPVHSNFRQLRIAKQRRTSTRVLLLCSLYYSTYYTTKLILELQQQIWQLNISHKNALYYP